MFIPTTTLTQGAVEASLDGWTDDSANNPVWAMLEHSGSTLNCFAGAGGETWVASGNKMIWFHIAYGI